MSLHIETPLRYPDSTSDALMTKRARWLVVGNCLLPGLAQLVAGNRRLARVGLIATAVMYCGAICFVALWFMNRPLVLVIASNGIFLFVLQWLLVFYAILWLLLGFDALRMTRLVRVRRKWRAPIALLAVVLTVLPASGALWAANAVHAGNDALGFNFASKQAAVKPVDGRYNILLLGTDRGDDREGLRPDSISLVSVNAQTGESFIVGLPRDIMQVPFAADSPMHELYPEGFCVNAACQTNGKLNAVYTETEVFLDGAALYPKAAAKNSEPGIAATMDAISGATGLSVQFYVLIDMDGFAQLIDALGGVEITVEERLPIGGQLDDNGQLYGMIGWIEPGKQRMDGFTAQWYARSRYGSATGDYDRMQRQRVLQQAILQQMNPVNVLSRFQEVAKAGKNLLKTDIPRSMLGNFTDLALKAKEHQPLSVEITPPEVDPEYPDWDTVRALVSAAVKDTTPQENAE